MKKTNILFIISLTLLACHQKSKNNRNVDSFYTNQGDFDLSRFPLVKPYEISTAIPSHNWIISSIDKSEVLGTIPGTNYINVVDSAIFAHSNNTILDGQPIKEAWFIIIPKQHILKGFKSYHDYLNYLSFRNIKEPKMYVVTEVFQHFVSKDTLDWKELNHLY